MRGPHTAMKSGPHLPQLEKALAQKQRPNTAISKLINLKKKEKKMWHIHTMDYYSALKRKFDTCCNMDEA